ncbi:MAG: hypothetical protein INQ03_15890 [Candidatus Heimdallarchaeota archaeon]|nr:hypothetical protein [Candidatus Heimdallarchaeota archaeon]
MKRIFLGLFLLINIMTVSAACQNPDDYHNYIYLFSMEGEMTGKYLIENTQYYDNTGWCTIDNYVEENGNGFYINDGGVRLIQVVDGVPTVIENYANEHSDPDYSIVSITNEAVFFSNQEAGSYLPDDEVFTIEYEPLSTTGLTGSTAFDVNVTEIALSLDLEYLTVYHLFYRSSTLLLELGFSYTNNYNTVLININMQTQMMKIMDPQDNFNEPNISESGDIIVSILGNELSIADFTTNSSRNVLLDSEINIIGTGRIIDNLLYILVVDDEINLTNAVFTIDINTGEVTKLFQIPESTDRLYILDDYILSTDVEIKSLFNAFLSNFDNPDAVVTVLKTAAVLIILFIILIIGLIIKSRKSKQQYVKSQMGYT